MLDLSRSRTGRERALIEGLSDSRLLSGTPRQTQLLNGAPGLVLSKISSYVSEGGPLCLWTSRNRPSIA